MNQLRRQNELRNEKEIISALNVQHGRWCHIACGFIEEQDANCSYGKKRGRDGGRFYWLLLCRSTVAVHAIVTAIIAVGFIIVVNITALHIIIIIKHIVYIVATTSGLHVKGGLFLHCCAILFHRLGDFDAIFLSLFQ